MTILIFFVLMDQGVLVDCDIHFKKNLILYITLKRTQKPDIVHNFKKEGAINIDP